MAAVVGAVQPKCAGRGPTRRSASGRSTRGTSFLHRQGRNGYNSRVPRMLQLCCLLVVATSAKLYAADARVEFNRDVRPILAENCFQCHGPDKAQRKGQLRLDMVSGAAKVLVPGDPQRSELYRRITAADPKEHMPPPKSGRQLSGQQTDLLRRW